MEWNNTDNISLGIIKLFFCSRERRTARESERRQRNEICTCIHMINT